MAAVVLATTSNDGATTHLPALALRGLAIVGSIWLWPRAGVRLRRRDLIAPLVAVLVVVGALPSAAHFGPALQAVTSTAAVVGLYLALIAATEDHTFDLLLVCGGVAAVHALWAILEWGFTATPRGHGGFFNPNDLAAFLAPLAIMATSAGVLANPGVRPRRRTVFLPMALVLSLGVVATGSRSGLLALGLGLVLLGLSRAWKGLLPTVLVLIFVVAVVPGLRGRWLGEGDPFAFNRRDIWKASVEVALHEPLGVGLGGYTAALRRHGVPLKGPVRYAKVATDAHCEPLTAWVELGAAGLVASLLPPVFLLVVILYRSRRRSGAGPVTTSPPAALATLAAFAIPACLSASLHVPPVALLGAVWAAHLVRQDDAPQPTWLVAPLRWHRALGAATLVAALSIAVPGVVSSMAFQRAAQARDSGDLNDALSKARLSTRVAPWNLGPAMLFESLRFATGAPPVEVGEALIDLAARFPTEPQPVERAAWILEGLPPARTADAPARGSIIVGLRTDVTRRDPKNALAFVALARAHERAGDEAGEAAAFAQGLEVEPNCGACLAYLARVAERDGRYDEARRLNELARRADEVARGFRGRAREILSLTTDSQKAPSILNYGPP